MPSGRRRRGLDQPRLHRAVVHPDREVQPRADRLRHLRRERDHPVLAGRNVEPMDLAAIGRQHGLSVGREGIAGDQVAGVPRLLLVALDRQLQPALLAAGQVADPQPGLVVDARSIDELGPIGREGRAKGAAVGLGDRVFIAGHPVATRDLRKGKMQVVISD